MTLQHLRERAGLEQTEAASLAGIRPETLSRYETGKRPMPADTWSRLQPEYEKRGVPVKYETETAAPAEEIPAWLAFRIGMALGDLRASIAYQRDTGSQLAARLQAVEAHLERLAPAAQARTDAALSAAMPDGFDLYATREQAEAEAAGTRTPTRKRAG